MYAQITIAVYDPYPGGLEGFAPLSGKLPASVFAAAIEDGQSMDESGRPYSVFVDLMDGEDTQRGEKCISVTQAAEILSLSPEGLPSLGRQRLAQINDEDAAHVRALSPSEASAGKTEDHGARDDPLPSQAEQKGEP
jgi:hypothetical protein